MLSEPCRTKPPSQTPKPAHPRQHERLIVGLPKRSARATNRQSHLGKVEGLLMVQKRAHDTNHDHQMKLHVSTLCIRVSVLRASVGGGKILYRGWVEDRLDDAIQTTWVHLVGL